jgi:hypothetical protein
MGNIIELLVDILALLIVCLGIMLVGLVLIYFVQCLISGIF